MLNKSAVREVIYLSAMQHKDSDSPHLAARRLTGEILADSRVPVTEIRAAIIVGPAQRHSRSCATWCTTCRS